MKKSQKKLSLNKQTLKNLTVRTGVAAGLPKTCPPYGTCVPYGSEGTSTYALGCCTAGGQSL